MNRDQLEHVIRAAGAITNSKEFIVVGSQASLGPCPEAPEELLVSTEVDIYIREKPELSTLIDGTIGELSPFHQTFGYYGHGVGPGTAILPEDWESRLSPITNENTNGVTDWCLSTLGVFLRSISPTASWLPDVRRIWPTAEHCFSMGCSMSRN